MLENAAAIGMAERTWIGMLQKRLTRVRDDIGVAIEPSARAVPARLGPANRMLRISRRALAPFGRRGQLATYGEPRPALAMRLAFVALFLLPTVLASVYFGFIASDRYESEARFVVRTTAKTSTGGGLAALLQMAGISRAQDESYAVQDYLTSRDALLDVNKVVPLATLYGRPEADVLARYPSIIYSDTFEDLHRYMGRMISVNYNASTGIGTLTVQAFRPEDARDVARELLASSEQLVNRINERVTRDLIQSAEAEVSRAEEVLVKAQVALTAFRNRELILDPTKSSVVTVELIGRLSAEVAQARVQLSEMLASAPNSPQAESMRRRIAALQSQVAEERARTSSTSSDGLANQIAEFERLNLQREFAGKSLATALASLESARNDARRQQIYLEKIVEPNQADLATMPLGLRNVVTTAGVGLVAFLLLWLFTTGIREHGVGARR